MVNLVVLKISEKRKKQLMVDCLRIHLNHNNDVPAKITHEYMIGILIDYYMGLR